MGMGHMGIGFGHMMSGGGGFFMMFFSIIIVIAVIYFISNNFNKSSSFGSNQYSSNSKRDPEEIARERYARGEIEKEEFNEIMKDLRD